MQIDLLCFRILLIKESLRLNNNPIHIDFSELESVAGF